MTDEERGGIRLACGSIALARDHSGKHASGCWRGLRPNARVQAEQPGWTARARRVANLAGSLAHVTLAGVGERSITYFEKADAELGRALREAVVAKRSV